MVTRTTSGKRSGDYGVSVGLCRTCSPVDKSPICNATWGHEINCIATGLTVDTGTWNGFRTGFRPGDNKFGYIGYVPRPNVPKCRHLKPGMYLNDRARHPYRPFFLPDLRPTSPSFLR